MVTNTIGILHQINGHTHTVTAPHQMTGHTGKVQALRHKECVKNTGTTLHKLYGHALRNITTPTQRSDMSMMGHTPHKRSHTHTHTVTAPHQITGHTVKLQALHQIQSYTHTGTALYQIKGHIQEKPYSK